jgi:hypothetical protein
VSVVAPEFRRSYGDWPVIPGATVVHLAAERDTKLSASESVCGQVRQGAFVLALRDFPSAKLCSWCQGRVELGL